MVTGRLDSSLRVESSLCRQTRTAALIEVRKEHISSKHLFNPSPSPGGSSRSGNGSRHQPSKIMFHQAYSRPLLSVDSSRIKSAASKAQAEKASTLNGMPSMIPNQTLIFIAMPLCGSYPTTLKSSTFHPSISPPGSRAISSVGNSFGTRSICTSSASRWSK